MSKRFILMVLGGALGVLAAGVFIASMWFWFRPVGINNYLNKATIELVLLSPQLTTQLGLIDNTILDFHSGKLDDYSRAGEERALKKLKKVRDRLNRYGPDGLEGQELLSWRVAARYFDDLIRLAEFERSGYRVNQISGVTVDIPRFLTDTHLIVNERSAKRYVSRVSAYVGVLKTTRQRIAEDADAGVIPPRFVLDKTIESLREFIEPGVDGNVLLRTLPERLDAANGISSKFRESTLAKTRTLVESGILPEYEALIAQLEALLATASASPSIARLPQGAALYRAYLQSNTTTDLTAEDIHMAGLREVERVAQAMTVILDSEGVPGETIGDRISNLMNDPAHHFEDSDAGRSETIAYLETLNEGVMAQAGAYFSKLPTQSLEIVRIPEYAEDSAPGGYYMMAALDGSRPGRFYINLSDMSAIPRWTLPTLMYHEAAPGHHFQISKAQSISGLPLMRKLAPFTAYLEGWALYAERLVSEDMGLYENDKLGDLGRLQAEMFRAARLVVDTGLHAKGWSRQEAIDYMVAHSGMARATVEREVDRYTVWPGQATSYKVGELAFLEMRREAELALGADFDLRAFHDVVLENGPLPLNVLGDVVADWIDAQSALPRDAGPEKG
ncbi:MAG: DUF885 domain-containing protein [Pseudomonadota bacterium]